MFWDILNICATRVNYIKPQKTKIGDNESLNK
jgi:hypothetical protein